MLFRVHYDSLKKNIVKLILRYLEIFLDRDESIVSLLVLFFSFRGLSKKNNCSYWPGGTLLYKSINRYRVI